MKFSNGRWRLRDGVQAAHPVEVRDLAADAGRIVVHAPTRRIRRRGELSAGPVVTLGFSSPMPDVIGVSITHFEGEARRAPRFGLSGTEHEAEISEDGRVLTAGALSVRIHDRQQWQVDFSAGGRVLTSSAVDAMGFMGLGDRHYVREQLNLGVGDLVYGLGERFGPLVRNGQVVDIRHADAGEQACKNVPFYLTNAGYGVFVDHPGHVSFEVASEAVSRLQFSVEGQCLEYFLIYGPTPKEILRKYTALTGRPALPPTWSFGLWLTASYDEDTVSGFVDGMIERDLPLSVFHVDCFWTRQDNWRDPRACPDPAGILQRLKSRGPRISVWINPYVAQRSPLFAEGLDAGYLLRKPNGDVWQWDLWQPGMALVDFTNPAARDWYSSTLDALLEQGVDCFKTDFGERVPTDVVYFDGSDPERMHNYYTYLYNQTVFEVLRKRRGDGDAVVFARSATAGSQQFPVHWSGDRESTYESMAETLRGGLSLGLSGFGFWSHDIGGFEGTPDPALFKRWIAFGLLSSHSSFSYRVPWLLDDEAVDVLRIFSKLKARLMPYLQHAAQQATTDGTPLTRAMALEFPDDPACLYLERQYMLGDSLLIAPVFCDDGDVSFYVPDGVWTDYFTGEEIHGPRWVRMTCDFRTVPLLVRPNTVLPLGAVDDRPDYDHAEGVTLQVYRLADGVHVTTTVGSSTFHTRRAGDSLHIDAQSPPSAWQVAFPDGEEPIHATGAALTIVGID